MPGTPLKELLRLRHENVIKQGGSFTFSLTHSRDVIAEIEDMGTEFTDKYRFTVARIPGFTTLLVCFNLKDRK